MCLMLQTNDFKLHTGRHKIIKNSTSSLPLGENKLYMKMSCMLLKGILPDASQKSDTSNCEQQKNKENKLAKIIMPKVKKEAQN